MSALRSIAAVISAAILALAVAPVIAAEHIPVPATLTDAQLAVIETAVSGQLKDPPAMPPLSDPKP
jgi:hypothetical protein